MTDKTDALISRAIDWYQNEPRLAGLVLYGSTARGQTHATSDVDLVIVTRPGQRDPLWAQRSQIAELLLAEPIAWSHDLPWQGDYRYQAWRPDLLAVDLTFDDGRLDNHETFATGQPTVIAGELIIPAVGVADPTEQAAELHVETWVWLLGIHNQIQQGRNWDAHVQLINLIDTRLRAFTNPDELTALLPSDLTPTNLIRSLAATTATYAAAIQHLNITTDNPLAPRIMNAIQAIANQHGRPL